VERPGSSRYMCRLQGFPSQQVLALMASHHSAQTGGWPELGRYATASMLAHPFDLSGIWASWCVEPLQHLARHHFRTPLNHRNMGIEGYGQPLPRSRISCNQNLLIQGFSNRVPLRRLTRRIGAFGNGDHHFCCSLLSSPSLSEQSGRCSVENGLPGLC